MSRVLKRLGLNKLSALEPAEPIRRYKRKHPRELIHIAALCATEPAPKIVLAIEAGVW